MDETEKAHVVGRTRRAVRRAENVVGTTEIIKIVLGRPRGVGKISFFVFSDMSSHRRHTSRRSPSPGDLVFTVDDSAAAAATAARRDE